MKNIKRWSYLLRVLEILFLIAAIALVVYLVPDIRKAPPQTTSEGTEQGERTKEEESGTGQGKEEVSESKLTPDQMETLKEEFSGKRLPSDKNRTDAAEPAESEETKESYKPPVLAIASDLHFMSPAMTDFGEAFELLTAFEDGKVEPYLDEITDAFLYEVQSQKPSALILSGDLSLNSEKVNHGELARKLRRLQSYGVPVLVLPGNHDINHPLAATYYGDEMVPTETVDADGFYEIYHEFGYDGAADTDEESLSYLYKLDERYWIMMLDSCIYFPENEVGGRIRRSTLSWMERWLVEAQKEQVTIIPVAHHNLLKQSVLYSEDCTLKNSSEVLSLLEKYKIPIYISGHLHLQRIKKNISGPSSLNEEYGIHEIVSNSLSIPPCQYGILSFSMDKSLDYRTKAVDVESWAKKNGSTDENLLSFSAYSREFLVDIIGTQIYKAVHSIPDERKEEMAKLYGTLNSAYCKGTPIDAAKVKQSEVYFYWERYLGQSKLFDHLSAILKDTKNDHNRLKLNAGEDF